MKLIRKTELRKVYANVYILYATWVLEIASGLKLIVIKLVVIRDNMHYAMYFVSESRRQGRHCFSRLPESGKLWRGTFTSAFSVSWSAALNINNISILCFGQDLERCIKWPTTFSHVGRGNIVFQFTTVHSRRIFLLNNLLLVFDFYRLVDYLSHSLFYC